MALLTCTINPALTQDSQFSHVNIQLSPTLTPAQATVAMRTASIMQRQITSRCNATVAITPPVANTTDLTPARSTIVVLTINASLGAEGFVVQAGGITGGAATSTTISGGDPRGLLFGAGKWLRTSGYEGPATAPFSVTTWRGEDSPRLRGSFRAHYLAVHYNNFYQAGDRVC
jgi:hypothetical protein